jgi:hypothetical protein
MIMVLFYYPFFFHSNCQKEVEKKGIRVIYFYKFKLGRSAAQTA